MKVLLVSPNFYPEKTGIGVTATDCACFLKELGHDVEVLTSVPYYPEWEIHKEYRGKFVVRETFQDIPVTRVWLYVPKVVTTVKRILQEVSFTLMLALMALFKRCDKIVCVSPPLSASAALAIVALLRRKPFWLNIKDIQPDAAICLGMLTNKKVIAVSRFLERVSYRLSDKILVLSQGMKDNLIAKGISTEKIEIVPDSIDVEELYIPDFEVSRSEFRKKHSLEEKFIALYSGNIGVKQNPEIIVEAARYLRDSEDIFFAVVGEGAMRPRLEELIAEYGLSNIQIYPLVERNLLADLLASADVLLMPQKESVLDIVVPSKLLSYLTSATPVVASVHPKSEAAKFLGCANAGFVVDAEDTAAFAEAILEAKKNSELAEAVGRNGMRLIRENYSHDVVKNRHYKTVFSQ